MALTEASPVNRTIRAAGVRFKVTLSGAVNAGDLLGYSSGWKQALATVGTAIQGKIVALESGASGDVIECALSAVLDGFTGGTVGGLLYLAEGTSNGQYTETAPSTTGDVNTIVGYILSATMVCVEPSVRAGSVA